MEPAEKFARETDAVFSWNGVGVQAFGNTVVEDNISRMYERVRRSVKHRGPLVKRMLVIDGMNLLHCGSYPDVVEHRRELDCATILPVIRFFILRRHLVQLVLPSFSLYDVSGNFKGNWVLRELKKLGILVSVRFKNHDDLVALCMAKENDGSVITRDNFRDHERIFPHLFDVSKRNIRLKFAKESSDFFSNEKGEPFYKAQFRFLEISPDALFSFNGDADFDYVKALKWDSSKRRSVIRGLDGILCMVEAVAMRTAGRSLPESHILSGFERVPKSLHEFEICLQIRTRRLEGEERECVKRKAVAAEPGKLEEFALSMVTATVGSTTELLPLSAAVKALEHDFARKVVEEIWCSLPADERTLWRLKNRCKERDRDWRPIAEDSFPQQSGPSVSELLEEDQRLLRSLEEALGLLGGAFCHSEIVNAWNATRQFERTAVQLRRVCMESEQRSYSPTVVTDRFTAGTSGCQKAVVAADVPSFSSHKVGGAFMQNEYTGRKVEKLNAKKSHTYPQRRKNGNCSLSTSNNISWNAASIPAPHFGKGVASKKLSWSTSDPYFADDEQAMLKERIWKSIMTLDLNLDPDVLYEVMKTTRGDIDADTIVSLYFDRSEAHSVIDDQKCCSKML